MTENPRPTPRTATERLGDRTLLQHMLQRAHDVSPTTDQTPCMGHDVGSSLRDKLVDNTAKIERLRSDPTLFTTE